MRQYHASNKPGSSLKKAEIKILIIMIYYIIMGAFTLTSYTYFLAIDDETVEAFQVYFACQRFGIVPGKDCGESLDIHLQHFRNISVISYFLLGLLPTMILIFTVNCNCFDNCINKYKSKKIESQH